MIYTYQTLLADIVELNTNDIEKRNQLAHLLHVWANAYKNAPSEIIGVGLFTYAENILIEYQEKQQQQTKES